MSRLGDRIQAATVTLSEVVVRRRKAVIVAFLLVTAVFAGGMTMVSTDSDATDSFTQDIPAQNALDAVEDEFEDPFAAEDESTQLVHTGTDVLSRQAMLANLRVLDRVDRRESLRMASARGPATLVATQLDRRPRHHVNNAGRSARRRTQSCARRSERRASNPGLRVSSPMISTPVRHLRRRR